MVYLQITFLSSFIPIGGPVVGCFFFLSGYGLNISYQKKGSAYIQSFLQKRFNRILPQFLIMTALAIIILIVFLHTPATQILIQLLKGYPPLPTSWYVYSLLLFYLLFYASARLTKTPARVLPLLLLLTLIYMAAARFLGFGGWWYSSILSLPLGYAVAAYQHRLNSLIANRPILSSILVILILWTSWTLATWQRQIFQPLITAALPLLIYWIIKLSPRIPHSPMLNFIGSISYEIYLCQGLMLLFLPWLNPLQGFLLMFPGSLLTAYLLHKIINR